MKRKLSSLPLLLLAAVAMGVASHDAPVIRPGHTALETNYIKEGTSTFGLLIQRNGSMREIATHVLKTAIEEEAGKALITRAERIRNAQGQLLSVDSFAVRRQSLAPVFDRSVHPQAAKQLRFSPGHVKGFRVTPNGRTSIDVALDEPVFYANSVDLVLAALPLEIGYRAKLATFDVSTQEEALIEIRVVGEPEIKTQSDATCPSWEVEVVGRRPEGSGTYWIEKRSRQLIRFRSKSGSVMLVRRGACNTG